MPEQVSGAQPPSLPLAPVRLGDTELFLVPESDDVGGPDQILPGFDDGHVGRL